MEVIIISPEYEYVGEVELIVRLFQSGLSRYHLRKPDWSSAQCELCLERLPRSLHARVSIHQHYQLATQYDVGIHFKDCGHMKPSAEGEMVSTSCMRSRSFHRIEDVELGVNGYDYGFLSPIFPSLSKPDYEPSWTDSDLRVALKSEYACRLYGLGGIGLANAALAGSYGFRGIALYGAVWQSANPLEAFRAIRKEAA